MARLQQSLRQRSSASDSNFRSGKEEWFRLQWFAATTFRVRFYSSLPQRRMVSPAVVVAAATMSASDSNLRCHEGEWPACSSRRGCDLPRPILFFVAAKENGSACSSRSSDEVRVCSILRCREEERFRLQTATKQRLHRFLNSSSDLGITAGFCQETPSSVQ